MRRAFLVFILADVVMAAAASPSRGTVTARIVLLSTTIKAGSTMPGRVVLHNATGGELQIVGCGSPFAVVLSNDKIKPLVTWLACAHQFTIPVGWSSWPVEISASYSACGSGMGLVPCEHGDDPALPPGRYRAVLVQYPLVASTPPAVDVRVVG